MWTGGEWAWSGGKVRRTLSTGVLQGATVTLLTYVAVDGGKHWQLFVASGMIYTVGYAAQSVQNDRRKRSGFWKLSAADQAAVASAFWRGRPISRVLAPALLEYCGTASNVVYRSRRYLWCPVASAAVLAIAGTALFLSDVPDAVIRGAILLAIGLVMVIAVIGELRRIRRLPPKIRRAQRLAQASLVRRAGSDTPNSPLLSSSSRLEGSHEAQ